MTYITLHDSKIGGGGGVFYRGKKNDFLYLSCLQMLMNVLVAKQMSATPTPSVQTVKGLMFVAVKGDIPEMVEIVLVSMTLPILY